MKRISGKKYYFSLLFTVLIFLILLITTFLFTLGILLFKRMGIFMLREYSPLGPILVLAFFSIIFTSAISFLISFIPLKPINEAIKAIDQLAEGDYSTRLHLFEVNDSVKKFNQHFNHLAKELSSVELLRNEFINDFSHEFKTPIVSIRGFAKVLKNQELTKEEEAEYLDIIIHESERLSDLSTNILTLSRLSHQSILTDIENINISEQIRLTLVLLEKKWVEKNLQPVFDTNEHYLLGNRRLLEQLWINLLDNGIKFAPHDSEISILIKESPKGVSLRFTNPSPPIDETTLLHLFDKFYQGDSSHKTKGNGLGLTMVQEIVTLHHGTATPSYLKTGEFCMDLFFPLSTHLSSTLHK